jgi:phage terminase small subunit
MAKKRPIKKTKAKKVVKKTPPPKRKVGRPRKKRDPVITAKQDLFCREMVKGSRKGEAAKKAGFSGQSASAQATQLLAKDHIKKHIQKLKEELSEEFVIDVHTQLFKLEEARDIAKTQKNPAGMIAAIKEESTLLGLHAPTKTEANINGGGANVPVEVSYTFVKAK